MRALYFALSYRQHGGSGLGWSRADIDACPLPDLLDAAERLEERRRAEAEAIRAAYAKPAR